MKATRCQQSTFSSAQATRPRLAKRVQSTSDLLDAALKLIRLLDTPDEIQFLAPLIIREIIYRLLKRRARRAAEPSGWFPKETLAAFPGHEQLRENLDQPLKIENMARDLGMSVSGFHYHFKLVTAMSPVQFQKQIRLQEARRMMLGRKSGRSQRQCPRRL